MYKDKIIVHKCGLISGVGRYTEIPEEALDLQESNLGLPENEGDERVFLCTRSPKNPHNYSEIRESNLND